MVERFAGPLARVLAALAGVHAHEARAQDPSGVEMRQRVLMLLLALCGIVRPDVRLVNRQVGDDQLALVQLIADGLQIGFVGAFQKAVPQIGSLQVVTVFACFQKSENVHAALLQQAVERVGHDGDPHRQDRGRLGAGWIRRSGLRWSRRRGSGGQRTTQEVASSGG